MATSPKKRRVKSRSLPSPSLSPSSDASQFRGTCSHANLAAAAPIIPVSRTSFCRVPPGMRSIHPHKCHGLETGLGGACGREISVGTCVGVLSCYGVRTVYAHGSPFQNTSRARLLLRTATTAGWVCALVPGGYPDPYPAQTRNTQRYQEAVLCEPWSWRCSFAPYLRPRLS